MFLSKSLVSTTSRFFHTSAKLARDKDRFLVPTKDMLKEKYPNVFFGCFGNPNDTQCPECNKSDNHNYERYVKLCEEYKTSDSLSIKEDLDNGLKVFTLAGKSIFTVKERRQLIDFSKQVIQEGVFREVDALADKKIKVEEESHYVDWVSGKYC